MQSNKEQLMEIIQTLSDNQILFFLTFIKRIISKA